MLMLFFYLARFEGITLVHWQGVPYKSEFIFRYVRTVQLVLTVVLSIRIHFAVHCFGLLVRGNQARELHWKTAF